MHRLITILFIISSLFAKSSDFSIIIDKPFDDALYSVTQDYGRTISAAGFVDTIKTTKPQKAYDNVFDYLSSLSDSYSRQIHIVKVDAKADILSQNTLTLPGMNQAVGIVKTPQGGYFIGGSSNDGSLLLLKLGPNADILLKNKFAQGGDTKMHSISGLNDGGVFCVGRAFTSKSPGLDIFGGGLGLSDVYIARFTRDGALLWEKKVGTAYDDLGVDAAEAYDGSILVLAHTFDNTSKYITVARISRDGDNIWTKELKDAKNMMPHKIIRLRDGNFVLSLSQDDEVGKKQPRLLKIDINGNILKDKIVHTAYASALLDIKEFRDTKIAGGGYVQDRYDTDALAMLLDSDFNMLSQEHFGKNGHDRFNAIEILHDSSIAAVGMHSAENSQESNMWIVKLNSDLSQAQVSSSAEDIHKEMTNLFQQEISQGKIEIKENLHVALEDEALYFDVGKYELNDAQKEFLDSFAKEFLTFMYKNKELIEGFEISGHTSSEWGNAGFEDRYLKNQDLSMKRSFATLSYIFSKQDENIQKWLSQTLKSSGHGFSKRILANDAEDTKRSRRVTFRILLRPDSSL